MILKAPNHIPNINADNRALIKGIRNIVFVCCNTAANKLADKLAKKAHQNISQNILMDTKKRL